MDVTCDRCKAEYEFDEALLGERGTTVKCSACGHVFRVMPTSRDAVRSQLQLRYVADGSVRTLSSLRELQQRIRAGEVSLDDALGREGFPFRPLRDVPELKNFFIGLPGRQTARPEAHAEQVMHGLLDAPDSVEARLPVAPDSMTPAARAQGGVEPSTLPPPLPGTPERDAADAARAARRAAQQPQSVASRTMMGSGGLPPEARPRSFGRDTITGLGPGELALPPPPAMPQVGGRNPGSGQTSARPEPPSQRVPQHPVAAASAPSAPASASVQSAAYGSTRAAWSAAPVANPASGVPAGSTHPHAHRTSNRTPSGAASLDNGAQPSAGEVTVKPTGAESHSPPPQAPGQEPVRNLYLDASERPPPRAAQGGSRALLWAALLLLAAGGGWFGVTRMQVSGKAVDAVKPVAEPEPSAEAPPLAGYEDAALPGAQPTAEAPSAPPVPTAEEAPARHAGERPEPNDEARAQGPAHAKDEGEQNAKDDASDGAKDDAKDERRAEAAAKSDRAAKREARDQARQEEAKQEREAEAEPSSSRSGKDRKLARVEKAALANPENYGAQVDRGDALLARGDEAQAAEAYRAALALRPTGSEANCGLGFALLRAGKASESLPYFDQAASSGYAEANIGLGDAYRKLNQPSSAKDAYQAYLDRLPSGSRASYAREWLEKLSGGGRAREDARDQPESPPRPPTEEYRPAGELIEPEPGAAAPTVR